MGPGGGDVSPLHALWGASRGRLGRDTLSTLGANGFGALAAFFAGLVLARWLGPRARGTFELVLFVVNTAVLLFGLGLNIPTAVFFGSRPARGVWAYRTGLVLSLVVSLLMIPAAALIVPAIETRGDMGLGVSLVLAGIAGFLALSVLQLATAAAIGAGRIWSLNRGVLARWLAYLAGLLILQALVPPTPDSALAWFAGCALGGCAVVWFGLRHIDRSRKAEGTEQAPRLETLAFGMRGQLGNVLQFVSYRFDVMLVSLWVGQAALGVYAV